MSNFGRIEYNSDNNLENYNNQKNYNNNEQIPLMQIPKKINNYKLYNKYKNLLISNNKKALEFIKNINSSNTIYIVCHSHVMQKILENFKKRQMGGEIKCSVEKLNSLNSIRRQIDSFEKLKKNIKNENMWEFTIKKLIDNKKITFIRHAFSVANIYNERAKTTILGKISKSKIDQIHEIDSKLSLFGIISALKMSKVKNYIVREKQNVYVSCLIRTWMTALCLFLPALAKIKNTNSKKELKLIIMPGIREAKSSSDNLPEDFEIQINNIKLFLKIIKNISKDLGIDLDLDNIDIKIQINEVVESILPSINTKNISNNYKFWNINSTFLNNNSNSRVLYYKFNKELVEDGFKTCITNNKGKTERFKNIKDTNLLLKRIEETSDGFQLFNIKSGFPKPNVLNSSVLKGNNKEINSISRWREPFSIKERTKYTRYLPRQTKRKKDFFNRKYNQENIIKYEPVNIPFNIK